MPDLGFDFVPLTIDMVRAASEQVATTINYYARQISMLSASTTATVFNAVLTLHHTPQKVSCSSLEARVCKDTRAQIQQQSIGRMREMPFRQLTASTSGLNL